MKILDLLVDMTDVNQVREFLKKSSQQSHSHKKDTSVRETFTDAEEQEVMIPPLQQKIELLKKAVDVDNYYNKDEDEKTAIDDKKIHLTINVPKGQSDTKIELTLNSMKKLAGISKPVVNDAADDDLI